ncbi:MAG: hypothetical protein RIQ33_514 [Bacteroidota bacterium]
MKTQEKLSFKKASNQLIKDSILQYSIAIYKIIWR